MRRRKRGGGVEGEKEDKEKGQGWEEGEDKEVEEEQGSNSKFCINVSALYVLSFENRNHTFVKKYQ